MRFQPINDIAELCYRKGLNQVVICPGSRSAPITLAFLRHGEIVCRTFSDERSAGFIALGIAQQTKRPCILICTSGTAAYNFAPAVAEACFSKTPLLILTADRPAEWIGQQDGQTIYQREIYGKHAKKSFDLPQYYDHPDDRWSINRIINDAINLMKKHPQGPVHVNLPFQEPLYPTHNEEIKSSESVRIINEQHPILYLSDGHQKTLLKDISTFHNVLVVAGQSSYDHGLVGVLEEYSTQKDIPIVGDITSNLHANKKLIKHADLFLAQAPQGVKKSLQPDLLITIGDGILSKNIKLFLRQHNPRAHWHITASNNFCDTFQHLTSVIHTSPAILFSHLSTAPNGETFERQKQKNYFNLWEIEERRTTRTLSNFFPHGDLGEFELVNEILKSLPKNSILHLANSMSVRYANFVGLSDDQPGVQVYSNRGTSGIEGCTSTSVGHSFESDKMNVLITGDMAFFYDRNAFWHNHPLPNLRIVLLNNHGGAIFRMIDGPNDLPEGAEYFITEQRLNAKNLCAEFGIDRIVIDHRRKIKNALKDFFEESPNPKLLEIEVNTNHSKITYDNFKLHLRKNYEQ